jgi:hypothetical protein
LEDAESDYEDPYQSLMPRIFIPDNMGDLVRCGVEAAAGPGAKGACLWCGHIYYEYDRDIEDAHLAECTEYQAVKQVADAQ